MALNFDNEIPEWKNEGVAPSEELREKGFTGGYKPPATVFNWFWSKVQKCIAELQNKLKVMQTALANKADKTDYSANSAIVTDNSGKLIEAEFDTQNDYLGVSSSNIKFITPDTAPTKDSNKMITSGGVYTAVYAAKIVANIDLNNVDDEGYYWCHSQYAESVTNKPDDVPFFSLRVTRISEGVLSQELTTSDNRKFIRIYWSGGWTEWVRFATEEDISDIYFNIEYSSFVICTFRSYSNNLLDINSEVDLKAGDKFLVQITGTGSYTGSSGFTMTVFINDSSGTVDGYEINDTDGTSIKSIIRGKIAIFEVGSDNNIILKGYLDKFPDKLTLPNSRPLIIKVGGTEFVYDGSYGVTIPVDEVLGISHKVYVYATDTPSYYKGLKDGILLPNLRDAVTTLKSVGYGEIVLLPGTHNLAQYLSAEDTNGFSDLTIRGYSSALRDECTINYTGTTTCGMRFSNLSSITLKDFRFIADNATVEIVDLDECISAVFNNLYLQGGPISSDYMGGSRTSLHNLEISNCIFYRIVSGIVLEERKPYCVYIRGMGYNDLKTPIAKIIGNMCVNDDYYFKYYISSYSSDNPVKMVAYGNTLE